MNQHVDFQNPNLQFAPWSSARESLLRDNWKIIDTRQLAILCGCSVNSLLKKAKRMGLHKPKPGWPEASDAILREMWPEHYVIDIATRLGVTRNAVIGRAHRIGLENKRPDDWGQGIVASKERIAANAERRKQHALKKAQFAMEKITKHGQKSPPRDVSLPVVSDIQPLLLSITDLKVEHCRWPFGDAGAIHYCGHHAVNGQPYCYAHYCMAYQPTNPRTRAAVVAESTRTA